MSMILNTKIDVLFDGDWYTATIIDTNEQQVKVHFDDTNNDEDEWIDQTSDRLAALSTYTIPITVLPAPPIDGILSHSVYYQHNNEHYILLCTHELQTIHRFDIKHSTWEKLFDYPDLLTPTKYDPISLDTSNLTLYIMQSQLRINHIKYAKLDLLSKQWTVRTVNEDEYYYVIAQKLQFIPYPIQQLYLFQLEKHDFSYKIIDNAKDDTKFKLSQIKNILNQKLDNIIWCQSLCKLISISLDHMLSEFFYCNFQQQLNKMTWNKYEFDRGDGADAISIEYDVKMIVAYQHILFVFGQRSEVMFCIDLLYEKRYKVSKSLQVFIGSDHASIIKGNGNYLYLMDYDIDDVNDESCNYCYRISLLDIIPIQLQRFYQNKVANPLIFGYIAEAYRNNELTKTVPYEIVNLIIWFYPVFCE